MKTLYHFTSIERWNLIAASGRLNTTDSNLSRHRPHAGPDVVWLTTDADGEGHGLQNTLDGTDKSRVRITVELPNRDVQKWREWAVTRGIDDEWMGAITSTAGGGSGTWRVTEKPVPAERWVQVIDRQTGGILHPLRRVEIEDS